MLNLTIGSYTAMKCSYYQNDDGELCCKTVKVDGDFKSGVKVKARFHNLQKIQIGNFIMGVINSFLALSR